MTEVEVVDAFVKFLYNESPARIYELVYGARSSENEEYAYEKIKEMQWDPLRWWGTLDSEHCQRLVNAAIQRSQMPLMQTYVNKRYHLTRYALSCGYVERRGDRILAMQNGVYCTYDGEKRMWTHGGTLTEARKRLTRGLRGRSYGQSKQLAVI